jgi:hypothetical protein
MHATASYVRTMLADPGASETIKRSIIGTADVGEAILWLDTLPPNALLDCGHEDCALAAEHAKD